MGRNGFEKGFRSGWHIAVVVHSRVSLHTGIHRICHASAARTTRSAAGSSLAPAAMKTDVASQFLLDFPFASPDQQEVWGSDEIPAMRRALDIPFLALN